MKNRLINLIFIIVKMMVLPCFNRIIGVRLQKGVAAQLSLLYVLTYTCIYNAAPRDQSIAVEISCLL